MVQIGRRVGISPDNDTKTKLAKLSIACGMTPTRMANELVKLCLNNPNIINFVQCQHNKEPQYRVNARIEGNRCIYE